MRGVLVHVLAHEQPRGVGAGKGENNRLAFRALLESGQVNGCLAFDEGIPVGWALVGPRADFPRLRRGRATQSVHGEDAWAAPCFYIASSHRGRGIAHLLLAEATRLARERGAPVLEGFPVRIDGDTRYAATFAYVGVPSLFARAGFRDVTPPNVSRPVFLKRFRKA